MNPITISVIQNICITDNNLLQQNISNLQFQHTVTIYSLKNFLIFIVSMWFSSVTVKTFDVTMQYAETNLLRTSSTTKDWKVDFQSIYYRFYYQINSILYKCVIIESNVLHDLYLIEKFYPAKFFSIHSVILNVSGKAHNIHVIHIWYTILLELINFNLW